MALSAGAASLTAVAALVAGPTAPAAARLVSSCRSGGVPALSVTPARSPQVTGSILVGAEGRRITVDASPGTQAGVRATATAAWLEFCLRPVTVTKPVTLVTIAPEGVSVALRPNRRLAVSRVVRAGRMATTTLAADGAALVQVLLDRRHGRVLVFVDDGRRMTAVVVPATGAAGNEPVAFAARSSSGPHF